VYGTLAYRFWAKVKLEEGCWEWQAAKTKDGYGSVGIATSRSALAHRVVWELTRGPIPEGMYVCHHCDNPSCVRPSHLFLGTQTDNMRDAIEKGRIMGSCGEDSPSAKLSEEDVLAIRREYANGCLQDDLAKQYGVTQAHISSIVLRKAWRHI